ncbi:hypothetical protein Sjap_006098 [Stephania japonica]|uniref:Uncharacterized protein n=1 Tax=Stephania japonica TaxID=461633 RepID=A0AAP0K6E2_9MAGN
MGCFLACFGSSKDDRKRRKKPQNRVLPSDQRNVVYEALKPGVSAREDEVENNISSIGEPREKLEEQLSFGARRKVTFDLNIKAYEEVSKQEIGEIGVSGEAKEREKKEKGALDAKRSHSPANSADDLATSSMGSYPSNHRYQNCSNSDDEYDELDGEESDLDEEDYEFSDDEEDEDEQPFGAESSESFFSLPTEPKGGGSSTVNDDKEVNSPFRAPPHDSPAHEMKPLCSNPSARDRSNYVHSVLNPVENLSQWKVVKAKPGEAPLKPLKENTNLEDLHIPISPEPNFKSSSLSWKTSFDQSTTRSPPKQEVAVDASLSNWLSSTESTPSIKTKNNSTVIESADRRQSPNSVSPESLQDRPILGALTMEEIKQLSAASSPRKSPTWSPDEKPILGTVGSYWSHTGQTTNSSSSGSSCVGGIPNTTSKYREDKRVNWYSTPFEARLERALTTGAAEAYSTYPTRV